MAERVNVVIPTIGESVNEGTIGKWFFKEGDIVSKDQTLFELDSDKATMEVPATSSGRLAILVPAGKTASVGTTVATIETMATQANSKATPMASPQKSAPPQSAIQQAPQPELKSTPLPPSAAAITAPSVDDSVLKTLSPSKRRAVRDGTYSPPQNQNPFGDDSAQGVERVAMTTLRKRIAERLLESQQTTATLTTFNEIDMTAVNAARGQVKDDFQKKYGVKLGFMSFFSKAVIHALQAYPTVNARIDGDDILFPSSVNLGIAVSTDRGLVVPVIKAAQNLTYGDLEKKIADLAERARTQKLSIAEMSGGTFTITNGGIFGSLLSTPIINPPQSGILGMHKIEPRPMAIAKPDGAYAIEVRPMMYVALSYDHRLIDGATSVGFLVKVKEYLESVAPSVVLI